MWPMFFQELNEEDQISEVIVANAKPLKGGQNVDLDIITNN